MNEPIFFIHIPKTAGTAIRVALEDALGSRLIQAYPGVPEWDIEEVFSKPIPKGAVVFGHFDWGVHRRAKAFPRYATVIRHPVERISSWYRYMRTQDFEMSDTARRLSLAEMVATGYFELNNHMTAMLAGFEVHGNDDVGALEQAKINLTSFAFIATQVTLSEDVCRLSSLVQADVPKVSHVNESPVENIPLEDLEFTRDANRLDMDLYEFALGARNR